MTAPHAAGGVLSPRGPVATPPGVDAARQASPPERMAAVQRWLPTQTPVERRTLAGARTDRLFFAQVREDPRLEIEALRPRAGETIASVGSGGCTALSLLAAGAGRIVSIDVNRAQHHLVELKLAAVRMLTARSAIAFLGGSKLAEPVREATYVALRPLLSADAQAYWDVRRGAIRRGIIASGVSERFIAAVVRTIRLFVHGDRRIARLLACRSLEEQQAFYDEHWNSRRWRLVFRLLLNRAAFRRAWDDRFFRHVENPSFARHFHATVEHALTRLPIADNYFVHQMLTGAYPAQEPGGVPPYLSDTGAPLVAARAGAVTLIDGSFTDWLRDVEPGAVHGFAISNICEWMTPDEIEALFAAILRAAAPGARLCLRNFVGWTEIPPSARPALDVDEALSERLTSLDRSAVQRRFVVASVRGGVR